MARYDKVERAKKCKTIIQNQVEKYLNTKEERQSHSGQLKDFKGLMIRKLCFSTSVRVRKEGFLKFLQEEFLSNNDDVLEYLEPKKNIEAFAQSAYCLQSNMLENYEGAKGYPPYFLVQRTRQVVESTFIDYLRIKEQPTGRKREQYDEESWVRHKDEIYVRFLYAVAIYEIFLRQFWQDVQKFISDGEELRQRVNQEKDEEINRRYEKVIQVSDIQVRKQYAFELAEYLQNYLTELGWQASLMDYINYLLLHVNSLYAIFRVIVLIEQVNFNSAHLNAKKKEEKNANLEALFWKEMIESWKLDMELFAINPEWKKNLSSYYKRINTVVKDKQIFVTISDKVMPEFREKGAEESAVLKQYIQIIQKHTLTNRSIEEEQKLQEIELLLAGPIWRAVGDLQEII